MINEIKQRIDNKIMELASDKERRRYLGASSIGEECDRKIWYGYHVNLPIADPRVHRIMDVGHWMESYALAMLKVSGYEVFHEEGGSQFGFKDEELQGHCDGVIMINGNPLLLEIKSANDKRFQEMVRDGVERSNPVYYTQMQVYMHYLELDSALYFVVNKNNCEIHMEIVKYVKLKAITAVKRGKEIIREDNVEKIERKYKSKAFFRCRYCSYRPICWMSEPPDPSEEMLNKFELGGNFLLS